MESSELVEMYKTLLPIAKVNFGKEVIITNTIILSYTQGIYIAMSRVI